MDNGDDVQDVYDAIPVTTGPDSTKAVGSTEAEGSLPSVPAMIVAEDDNEPGPTSVYRACQNVIEVKRHRRLPHPHRGDYIACVVSDIKNRLGCPPANAANKLAVRRMANNIMTQHTVRPSHMRVVIEQIVAGVFVPDEADLLASRILESRAVAGLREEMANAAPRNIWQQWFSPLSGKRHVARVRA